MFTFIYLLSSIQLVDPLGHSHPRPYTNDCILFFLVGVA